MIDESGTRPFKLGVLSRRGPIAIDSQNIPHLAHIGGLTRILPELANHCEVSWVALNRHESGVAGQIFNYRDFSESKQLYELVISQAQIDSSSTSDWFCANYLWQLMHDLALPCIESAQLPKYLNDLTHENQKILETAFVKTNDAYFINDFHLAPSVKLLRECDFSVPISFCLHTPWPKNQQQDSAANETLRYFATGMLCADLINFQTPADLKSFVAFVVENFQVRITSGEVTLISSESYSAQLLVNPASVDATALAQLPHKSPSYLQEEDLLFVHIARSDPAKNTLGVIAAFSHLLKNRSLNSRRIFLDLYIVPSRQIFLAYQKLLTEIQTQVADFNSGFISDYQDPMRLHIDNDYAGALGALRRFDILLAPSWADGMNLVIKEAAALNERNGVIVATPKVGAMTELGSSCIIANSPRPDCLIQAIDLAINLPENERQQMSANLKSDLKFADLNSWALQIMRPIIELAKTQLTSFVRL
ncbi:MAG: trehalose-6-phosphate synthase [Actinomycetota bacterium]|nr:trehalose-6-phosphate synthase [Actinomycetota bacterium]